MKDWFYFLVYFLGYPPMFLAAAATVLHRDRARRKGGYILASTHFSPYDNPCLVKETPRVIHFVSAAELSGHPLARWFFHNYGTVPLDRANRDSKTVRAVVERLRQGQVIGMYPEGSLRTMETSVLNGGRLKPGIGRIAKMAGVPIIPAVMVGAKGFERFANWLPFKRIKYGINYGEPIIVTEDEEVDYASFETRLKKVYCALYAELKVSMDKQSVIS